MTRQLYLEMLSFQRPAWTPYEEAFITRYITPLNPSVDLFGNQIVDIGENPSILWSSHTDTVHYKSGFQELEVSKDSYVRRKQATKKQRKQQQQSAKWANDDECLGADCTTGVYIMIEMIKAKIPGRYVFHRAEEIGCLGSTFIRDKTPELLAGIEAAIAFDRKGTDEVITTQGHRTCSDTFALSMAAILGGAYKPSPHGSVTDTKLYSTIVPECTNIGVGYYSQHTGSERQDLFHLDWLVDKMINFNQHALVIERTPVPVPISYGYGRYTAWNADPETVEDLVRSYPGTVAEILVRAGMTFTELDNAVFQVQEERRTAAANRQLMVV